jgi:hypothetical protein
VGSRFWLSFQGLSGTGLVQVRPGPGSWRVAARFPLPPVPRSASTHEVLSADRLRELGAPPKSQPKSRHHRAQLFRRILRTQLRGQCPRNLQLDRTAGPVCLSAATWPAASWPLTIALCPRARRPPRVPPARLSRSASRPGPATALTSSWAGYLVPGPRRLPERSERLLATVTATAEEVVSRQRCKTSARPGRRRPAAAPPGRLSGP